jgi:glyoxylase-like metal-dependent hydrolase (beta-lactamase superfamily II)
MALFGPDGVLLVDTENRQVADKTLKTIRSFTSAPIKILVNTHIHSDHTGANAFFAQQGAVIFSQTNLQSEMLRPLRAPTANRPRHPRCRQFRWRPISTTLPLPASRPSRLT